MKCKICGIIPRAMWCFGGAWKWRTVCSDYPVCASCEWWFARTAYLLQTAARKRLPK